MTEKPYREFYHGIKIECVNEIKGKNMEETKEQKKADEKKPQKVLDLPELEASERIPWTRGQLANRADSLNTLIMLEAKIPPNATNPDGREVKIYLTLPEAQDALQTMVNKLTEEQREKIADHYNKR